MTGAARAAALPRRLACLALLTPAAFAGAADAPLVAVEAKVSPPGATGSVGEARPSLAPGALRLAPLADVPETDRTRAPEILGLERWNAGRGVPSRNGLGRPLASPVTVGMTGRSLLDVRGERPYAGGHLARSADRGDVVWTGMLRVRGAEGLRVGLAAPRLPDGTLVWAYGEDGMAQGPVSVVAADVVWCPSVQGERMWIEVQVPTARLVPSASYGFRIEQVIELFDLDLDGRPRSAPAAAPRSEACLEDFACQSLPTSVAQARRAVGRMAFVSGGNGYVCTGTLLNDGDAATFTPYFLTAEHCISTASEAASVEVWWDYVRAACGSAPPASSTLPKSFGATLLAHDSSTDFAFLRLSSAPAGRVFLGWTTGDPYNFDIHRLHHPHGNPLSYSRHRQCQGCGECGALPRSRFVYSSDELGGTAGGSSGAVGFIDVRQAIGQLFGACGPNPLDPCERLNSSVDGRFSVTYPRIAQYLQGGGSATTTTTTTPGTGGSTTTTPGPACDAFAAPGAGLDVLRTTADAPPSRLTSSCEAGSGDAPEHVYEWTPSLSGEAFIDTAWPETTFDTVVYVRTDDCRTGPEIVCRGGVRGSTLAASVESGRHYYIVVDGASAGAAGTYRLTVRAPISRSLCRPVCKRYCRTQACAGERGGRKRRCIRRCRRAAIDICRRSGQCSERPALSVAP